MAQAVGFLDSRESPGTGRQKWEPLRSFAPFRGSSSTVRQPSAYALGYILTLLRSYVGRDLSCLFSCCTVYPSGESLVFPNRLQWQGSDWRCLANCGY